MPVSADCENGYGHAPEDAAETVRQAAAAGLAGCSIEDTMLPDTAPYPFDIAAARIKSAAAAARDAAEDFVLTARADGVLNGHYNLAEAVWRLRAFEAAGADVLYAPMPPDMESLARVCDSVSAPVNVLAGKTRQSAADFARIGAARISLGGALAAAAFTAAHAASRAALAGDFIPLQSAASGEEIESILKQGGGADPQQNAP